MATTQSVQHGKADTDSHRLGRALPFLNWLWHYRRDDLTGDIMAGVIVAIMLVPQGMAYALLAGLPPEVGLYASIVPLAIYGLLGSSRVLAVGPTAVVSLLVISGVSQFAAQGTGEYLALALLLALLIGIMQVLMGLFRVGFLVNFLSHPVLSGFTSAAAIVIGVSQIKHVLGIAVPRTEYLHETIIHIIKQVGATNPTTLGLALVSIVILLYFQRRLPAQLKRWNTPPTLIVPLTKSGPLLVVALGILLVSGFGWSEAAGVAIVGDVPAGLPSLTMPSLDLAEWRALLPIAASISLISFAESISVGKALASKRRRKLDANRELIALGAANVSAAFTGGFPVTGGFSRSVVNFTAGANTGLASLITAGLVALTVTFLMPLFYFLPQAILAAIILVAVAKLLDFSVLRQAWAYNRADAASLLITFAAVLILGIETGLLVGVGTALVLYLWRTSQPHIAVVGRVGQTEHFRNVLRHHVQTCPHVMTIRVDESLYFANTQCLETFILNAVAENPEIEHMVLVCSAVNFIDTSALETLTSLLHELKTANVELYLAEVKGPVMDGLKRVQFIRQLGEDRVFLSTHLAMRNLHCEP
jgi:SulP family sulfate permease